MLLSLIKKLIGRNDVDDYQVKLDKARHLMIAINPNNLKGSIDISGLKNAVVLDTRYLLENHEEIIQKIKTAYPEA